MKCRTKLLAIVAVLVGCLAASASLSAVQIEAISSDFLASSFANTGGTFSIGVLTIDDDGDIVVEYVDNSQTLFAGGHVLLSTSLFSDISAGGVADGLFLGGSITLTDNTPSSLLTADIVSMEVKELSGQPDILVGTGLFSVTGGSLAADFGPLGEVFQLTFNLSPNEIEDFTDGSGTGISDLKLTPVPEPSTCLLFATAGLSALGWMRRRYAA